jgi:7-carboxy-7-deazaguanine synthase
MRVVEIFPSINGEVSSQHQGSLCTFIRMAGCNFQKNPCTFCDTPQALDKTAGKNMTNSEILEELTMLGNKNIVITGGEPFRQKEALRKLVWDLRNRYYNVSVETNGSVFIPTSLGVRWVADYKLPSSGNEKRMNLNNFINLTEKDIIKFVISDRKDFYRALIVIEKIIKEMRLPSEIALSPCNSVGKQYMTAKILQEWMQETPLLKGAGAILSLQLHKIIGVR